MNNKKNNKNQYFINWGKNVASIVTFLTTQYRNIINSDIAINKKFLHFLNILQNHTNKNITQCEAIELIAQHIITAPIFNALFENYNFVKNNTIANIFEELTQHLPNYNSKNFKAFYQKIHILAAQANTPELKQQLMLELYDNFYKNAFPKLTQRLGITFTPIEIVDFIINKTNEALMLHFSKNLASSNITITDPFTGTGTFINRIINSPHLNAPQAIDLYRNRLFAKEFILLSYYLATINIEQALHHRYPQHYIPFKNIELCDSFTLKQYNTQTNNIQIIIANPPYSKGQKNSDDNNQKIKHPELEQQIKNTYLKDSNATYKNTLYDNYIKAFRQATTNIKNNGIISFITPNAILEKETMAGLRKHFAQDFNYLYFINLRGDIRKNILSKKTALEGENIFGNGSMNGICISILIKTPQAKTNANIFYYDIGDNLTATQKKQKLNTLHALQNINWQIITPNKNHEWLNQTTANTELYNIFKNYIPISDIFSTNSLGVFSSRNAWVYNYSKSKLAQNMKTTINYYNDNNNNNNGAINSQKIKWTNSLKNKYNRNIKAEFNANKIVPAIYYPFTSTNFYYDKIFNDRLGKMPNLFSTGFEKNKFIVIPSTGYVADFSAIICDKLPYLQILNNAKCFFLNTIKNEHLKKFSNSIGQNISNENLFHYIYAILNNPLYTKTFANILKKTEPHIPLPATPEFFNIYNNAGKKLEQLHLNYETSTLYQTANILLNNKTITLQELKKQPARIFYVTKMKLQNNNNTNNTIIYNEYITIINIPQKAFEYKISNRSAIEWVISQQKISTDKVTNITNNPNDYAIENMQNPAYPLELILRIIYIAIETQKITNNLPSFFTI